MTTNPPKCDEESSDDDSYAGSAASIAAERERSDARLVSAIQAAFDPLPLDRAIVSEAQHSGLLNATSKELAALQTLAEPLCARHSSQLNAIQSLIRKTEANIDWLVLRTNSLARKQQALHPIEFAQSESRILDNEDV